MKKIPSVSCRDLRENFTEIINEVTFKSKKIAITRHKKVIAVIISPKMWMKIADIKESILSKKD